MHQGKIPVDGNPEKGRFLGISVRKTGMAFSLPLVQAGGSSKEMFAEEFFLAEGSEIKSQLGKTGLSTVIRRLTNQFTLYGSGPGIFVL